MQGGAALCTLIAAVGLASGARAQDAQVLYTVTQAGPPVFSYDLSFFNNLDPVAFAGYDLYDVTILLDGTTDVTVIDQPLGWTESVTPDFVEFFSFLAGEPPAGTDIAPGQSLGGFKLSSSQNLAGSLFTAQFVNPTDPANPVIFNGAIAPTGGGAGAPEPGSIGLAAVGLLGLAVMRRMRRS